MHCFTHQGITWETSGAASHTYNWGTLSGCVNTAGNSGTSSAPAGTSRLLYTNGYNHYNDLYRWLNGIAFQWG